MILELHERDAKVLEQILSILKNHPEIEEFEIDEEPMVSFPGLRSFQADERFFGIDRRFSLPQKNIGFSCCWPPTKAVC